MELTPYLGRASLINTIPLRHENDLSCTMNVCIIREQELHDPSSAPHPPLLIMVRFDSWQLLSMAYPGSQALFHTSAFLNKWPTNGSIFNRGFINLHQRRMQVFWAWCYPIPENSWACQKHEAFRSSVCLFISGVLCFCLTPQCSNHAWVSYVRLDFQQQELLSMSKARALPMNGCFNLEQGLH